MGYPAAYRSATARALGSFQKPVPYKPPVGPANDNLRLPANDNLRFPKPNIGRLLKGLARQLNPTPQVLGDGFLNAMNLLPGYAQPLDPAKFAVASTVNQLPLYKVWAPGTGTDLVGLLNQQDTRETGQQIGAPGSNKVNSGFPLQNFNNGGYVSSFLIEWKPGLNAYRGNELATWGPVNLAAGQKMFIWQKVLPLEWPAIVQLPYALIPHRQTNTWPQGHQSGPQPKPRTLSPPMVPRKPPGPGVKERKTKATRGMMGVIKFLGEVSEGVEVMAAFYGALPQRYKLKTKNPRPEEMAKQLYKHWDKVDLDTAIFDAVWGQATDMVWGRMGITSPGRYGGAMGANRALNNGLGKGASQALGAAHDKVAKIVNSVLGVSIKGG